MGSVVRKLYCLVKYTRRQALNQDHFDSASISTTQHSSDY